MTKQRIVIIGLGYVGLPLAVEFAKKYAVVGFDINEERIKALKSGLDATLEVEMEELNSVLVSTKFEHGLYLSNSIEDLKENDFFIVTVPTPIDEHQKPDLSPLVGATKMVSEIMGKDSIVIYESTVYPGATEEVCVPILEEGSGLIYNQDFFVGYSPERINPGDKERTVTKILKVTSGSTDKSAAVIDDLYASIITAGTYKASSIKVAEAAKVIENSQRDINIAFVNELAKIFKRLDIDTNEVLEAAGTKWNFLPFKPGLVGGHCIGVDPYYLAQKALDTGYNPEIILAGRRLNDSMGPFVASETVKLMIKKGIPVKGANVLVMGLTFKENCPDIRNSRAIDVVRELMSYETNTDVFDPWANASEVQLEYGIDLIETSKTLTKKYDAIVLTVAHNDYKNIDIKALLKEHHVVFDVKGMLPKEKVDSRL
ncbi:nucleotide sugar dehydrogenase [Urechidicola sp. KH5]